MKSSLLGRQCWQWLKLSLRGSLLSAMLYTTYKLFLTVKVKFHLNRSLFQLSTLLVLRLLLGFHGLPVVCALKKRQERRRHQHPVLVLDCKTQGQVCAPWVVGDEYASPLITLLLSCDLPQIHYWSWLSVAWLPIDISAGLHASLDMHFTSNKHLWQGGSFSCWGRTVDALGSSQWSLC